MCTVIQWFPVLPDSSRFHESKTALHEEDDDGHDEKEEVIDVFRMVIVAVGGDIVVAVAVVGMAVVSMSPSQALFATWKGRERQDSHSKRDWWISGAKVRLG